MRAEKASTYEVRQSRLRTAGIVVLCSLLPVTAMTIGLQDLSTRYMFFIVGLGIEATILAAFRRRVGSAVRRELLLAIDEQGVYLGPDMYGRPAMRESWSNIDSIVHFRGRVWTTSSRPNSVRHIGIVQGGSIVLSRANEGWWFSVRRAAAAADHVGGGTPVLRAPFFDQVPREWFHTIRLPREWLAANSGSRAGG
ncbi:hypothetical protein AB0C15_01430 [Micromonospora sp. NPDC048835]|uniref:hypothetical protein n=1 Tax=Micromonospora sp. NPDC048835 TaxID=3155147 RepID=UPI0033D7C5CA